MIVSLEVASNSIHAHDIDPDAPFFSRLPGKRPGQRFQLLSLRLLPSYVSYPPRSRDSKQPGSG